MLLRSGAWHVQLYLFKLNGARVFTCVRKHVSDAYKLEALENAVD